MAGEMKVGRRERAEKIYRRRSYVEASSKRGWKIEEENCRLEATAKEESSSKEKTAV